MAEGVGRRGGAGTNVRVVRCPKCENLLPELANFTVYKCGGCNATLQAKKPIPTVETPLEKSDPEKVKISENLDNSLNINGLVVDASSGADYRAATLSKAVYMNTVHALRSENEEVLKEPKEKDNGRNENIEMPKESDDRDCMVHCPSKAPVSDLSRNADESAKRDVEEKLLSDSQSVLPNGHHEASNEISTKGYEKDRVSSYRKASRTSTDQGIRFAPYHDEGPSNYHMKQNPGRPNRVASLEQDQAELLRKLDKLRHQLRQSCGVTDKSVERPTINKRAASKSPYGNHRDDTWFPDNLSSLNQTSSRHASILNGHNVGMPHFYHEMYPQSSVPWYRESYGPQTFGAASFLPHSEYPQHSYSNHIYSQLDPNHAIPYQTDALYHGHQPVCSCLHCYNRHWTLPTQGPPTIFSNQTAPHLIKNNGFFPTENCSTFDQQNYNQREVRTSLHSHQPHVINRATFKPDRRPCQPIAGAAPFIVCFKCSKVLELLPSSVLVKKNKFKLQCGSCSQVILVEIDGKRLITSAPVPTTLVTSDATNGLNGGMKESLPCDQTNKNADMSYYVEFDSQSYKVQSADGKLVLPSSFSNSSPEISEKKQGLSSSSSTQEGVESPDCMICHRDVPSSIEHPVNVEVASHIQGLPLREHFGYPVFNHVTYRPGKGSSSRHSDQEKVGPVSGSFKQSSVKDVPVATEMDLSADDYPNFGFSQDSLEVSRDEEQPKVSKGGESFFAGLIKKSFKDFRFNQSMENGRTKVSINGHPISDQLVKKGEKLAGPIYPGDYWYDYRAGFWGTMGQPCLGIIPPFIEEFNYPIAKTCAGGNTDVFVNGRELHQKDLDLLVGRGLPPNEGRSYIIEISGRVWVEDTGEELDSLGKLAPTVERAKHGFGMQVPRAII